MQSRNTLFSTAILTFLVAGIAGCGVAGRMSDGGNSGSDAAFNNNSDGGVSRGDMSQPPPANPTVVIAPGTPSSAPSLFGMGTDQSLAPTVVYPPDGALIPPNLDELEFQWTPGSAQLFEIEILGPGVNLQIYTVCTANGTSGCTLIPDEATWMLLSNTARGGTYQVTLKGTSSSGGAVGAAPARKLSFADEDMSGGLYYWAASSGGIYRYDFGLRGKKAETFYDPAQAGGVTCVGCHALSRDGRRIAVGLNAPTPAPELRALDVASRTTLFDQGAGAFASGTSNYEAFTPDASKLITTENNGLTIRDGATGALVGNNPALDNANMPDVSPDGMHVTFVRDTGPSMSFCFMMSSCPSALAVTKGGVWTANFDGTSFSNVKELVGGGINYYYPSYSPDGTLIAFNTSANNASYDAADAHVAVVSSTGGGSIDLASVNTPEGNSWPKWSPFIHHFQGRTILWLAFSSRRDYGLRQTPQSMNSNGGTTSGAQIWMVPVDAGMLAQGKDSGFPPFWLPFQDFSTSNHIPQWVEQVDRAGCSSVDQSGCMTGEMCVNGECLPGPS